MTVLVGGLRALRVLDIGADEAWRADAIVRVTLSNDFFLNLLDDGRRQWKRGGQHTHNVLPRPSTARAVRVPSGRRRRVDLIFGSHSQLRALAEVYASSRIRRTKFVDRLRGRLGQGDEPGRFDAA